MILKGRENLVRFSPPSPLRYMADKHGTDEAIAHCWRGWPAPTSAASSWPPPDTQAAEPQPAVQELLDSSVIQQAIEEEATGRDQPGEGAKARAHGCMDEIASNFSYRLIRLGELPRLAVEQALSRPLGQRSRAGASAGPGRGTRSSTSPAIAATWTICCSPTSSTTRGMVPPHIAAGINLNFWPAGPSSATAEPFFIRRTFKGNPLYSTVFREYLNLLFAKGYFGGVLHRGRAFAYRSPAAPKTGMLATTLQAMMRGLDRPVTLVPVYLGYEHVMEVNTYHNELKGSRRRRRASCRCSASCASCATMAVASSASANR